MYRLRRFGRGKAGLGPVLGCLSLATALTSWSELPSTCDLRSAGPNGVSWMTSVGDQSYLGDCWAWANTEAFESSLLKQGHLPTSSTPPALTLSVWHLSACNGEAEWLAFNPAKQGYEDDTSRFNWGGSNARAISYFSRGRGVWPIPHGQSNVTTVVYGGGPVFVSNDLKNAFPLTTISNMQSLAAELPAPEQPSAFLLREAHTLDQSLVPERTEAERILALKRALMDYGALAVNMYAYLFKECYDTNTCTFYYSGESNANHFVTIIGWDDNKYVPKARTNGAWLIQNQWGVNPRTGTNGVFWASYLDAVIGRNQVTAYKAEPMSNTLGRVYSDRFLVNDGGHNPGLVGRAGNPVGEASRICTRFVPETTGSLGAIGVSSLCPTQTVTIRFYNGWTADGPIKLQTNLTFCATLSDPGYYLLDLPNNQVFNYTTEQEFVVEVDYGCAFSHPIPYHYGATGELVSNQFYVHTSGGAWVDLSNIDPKGIYPLTGVPLLARAKPVLTVSVPQAGASGPSVRLSGLSGHGRVFLYTSSDLVNWTPVYTNAPVVGALVFPDAAVTQASGCFYRAMEE